MILVFDIGIIMIVMITGIVVMAIRGTIINGIGVIMMMTIGWVEVTSGTV